MSSDDEAWQRYYAEAEAAATVSALGYRIDPCPRCAAIDEALAEPGTRIFREPNGGIVFVASDFDGDLADELLEGSRELVPHGPYLPDDTGGDREPTACPSCGYTGEHILTFFGVQRSCLLTCGRHGCGFEWWEPKREWSPEQQSEEMGEQQ